MEGTAAAAGPGPGAAANGPRPATGRGPAAGPAGAVDCLITVPMSATAYRFRLGHRLRLQVSAGAHPRFARNTGTGEPWATTTRLAAVDLEIVHDGPDPGGLSLPVMG